MTGTDLILPLSFDTGELIRFDDLLGALNNASDLAVNGTPAQQADMIEALRRLDAEVAGLKRLLSQRLADYAATTAGKRTFPLGDGRKVELSKGEKTVVDAEKLAAGLRRAGAPEQLVDEIVVTTVTHKVDLVRAKQAAAANPKYKRVLDRASTTVEEAVSVSIKRG